MAWFIEVFSTQRHLVGHCGTSAIIAEQQHDR
jgi:hypothetical protein